MSAMSDIFNYALQVQAIVIAPERKRRRMLTSKWLKAHVAVVHEVELKHLASGLRHQHWARQLSSSGQSENVSNNIDRWRNDEATGYTHTLYSVVPQADIHQIS